MRLIDADALSAFVGDLRSTLHKEQSTFKAMTEIEFNTRDYMLLNFQQTIDNAPPVEERPTGEWIVVSNGTTNHYACSKCGHAGDFQDKFCRECGADMRVKHELNNELNELKEAENE